MTANNIHFPALPPGDILDQIFDLPSLNLSVLDGDCNFIKVSSTYARAFAKKPEDLLGKNFFDVFPGRENETIFDQVRDTGMPVHVRARPFSSDPSRPDQTYWDWSLSPILDKNGDVKYLLLHIHDVTKQIRAEEEKNLLTPLPQENPNPVLRFRQDGTLEFANAAAGQLVRHWDCRKKQLPQDMIALFNRLIIEKRRDNINLIVGETHYNLDIIPSNRPGYVNIYGRDITQRRIAEIALEKSEQLFRTSLDTMHDGFAILNAIRDNSGEITDFMYIYVNDAGAKSLGVSKGELSGMTILSRNVWKTTRALVELYKQVVETGTHLVQEAFPVEITREDRHELLYLNIRAVKIGDGIAIAWSDVSEHIDAEMAVHEYARRLEVVNRIDRIITSSLEINQVYTRLVEEMSNLVEFDRTSIILIDEQNLNWQIVWMWSRNEPVLEKGVWKPVQGSIFQLFYPDPQPLLETEIGELGDFAENASLRKEGIHSRILVPLMIENRMAGVLALGHNQPAKFSSKDLEPLTLLADQLAIVLQNSQLYEKVQVYSENLEQQVEDRTEKYQAANRELEAFTYSVSHDLRAPLRAIDGFVKILMDEYLSNIPEEAQHYLTRVSVNARQMGQLIDGLLSFSRLNRQALDKGNVDTRALVQEALAMTRQERKNPNLQIVIGELSESYADSLLLKQVWVNLISNAIKYSHKRDNPRVEIGSFPRKSESGQIVTVFFVKDNGVGFDMKHTEKLFGVFQRLHSNTDYEGTGVGLATVQRIIHRHGGRIWAEAEPNQGAAFYFTLQ